MGVCGLPSGAGRGVAAGFPSDGVAVPAPGPCEVPGRNAHPHGPAADPDPDPGLGLARRERELRAAFAQGGPADVLAPGALLAALAEAALGDPARLSDDELTGALEAARRLQNRAHYQEVRAIADLARRRCAQHAQDAAAGLPPGRRRAQFPDLELAAQLLVSRRRAACLLEEAAEITTRLPLTLAGMAAGLIDASRASVIAAATLCLGDADAARVDAAVAAGAHEVRAETVARRAAALAVRLDPEAVLRGREDARRHGHRVEARREQSGNASLSVREADTTEVLAVKAALDDLAVRLRNGGAAGTLDTLRATAAIDRLLARDPLDRLAPPPPEPPDHDDSGYAPGDSGYAAGDARFAPDGPGFGQGGPGGPDDAGCAPDDSGFAPDHGYAAGDARFAPDSPGFAPDGPGSGDAGPGPGAPGDAGFPLCRGGPFSADAPSGHDTGGHDTGGGDTGGGDTGGGSSGSLGAPPGRSRPAGFPARVNLIVPAATLLGWGSAPAQVGAWGLADPQQARDIVAAASLDPRTRWCATFVNEGGEAVAHACAPGRHRWHPGLAPPSGARGHPGPRQQHASLQAFLVGLGITPASAELVARRACDHAHAEPGYAPSRRLRHLVQSRSQTCAAPGCATQAIHADLDHVTPYPAGQTCECNLQVLCRAHHRAKQAADWLVESPEPGVTRWTLPNGRTRTTHPTRYDT